MAAPKGISLSFDLEGNAKVILPVEGELCSGIVMCANCKDKMCHAVPDPISIYDACFKQCPVKKWHSLTYTGNPDFLELRIKAPEIDGCAVCGCKVFWRIDKSDPWHCQRCNRPPQWAKVESQKLF